MCVMVANRTEIVKPSDAFELSIIAHSAVWYTSAFVDQRGRKRAVKQVH